MSANPSAELRQAVPRWADKQLSAPEGLADLYALLLRHIEPPLFETVLEAMQNNRGAAAEVLGIRKKLG